MSQFEFIDLFAGIGGFRIPLEAAGGRCVFTSEIDKYARKTYAANFGLEADQIHGDIRLIEAGDVPDHDLLVGGFPCQPFSHAGLRQGFDDTRGTLFFEIQRIIEAKKPKAIVLENVRGLKGHDRGNTLRRILEILGREYVVSTRVFNSKDFGLPQNRTRIYICAIRADLPASGTFNLGSIKSSVNPTLLGDILEEHVEEKYTISDRLWAGHQRRKAEHQAKGNGFGYRIFNSQSLYTSTISARYYKDGSEILIEQRGRNPRKLTPREAARLQGFPDWFVPCDSEAQAYKQFGNAVSVHVVQAIADGLAGALFRD
jgi:DNA (cytosine-5)-methyltransferase 1